MMAPFGSSTIRDVLVVHGVILFSISFSLFLTIICVLPESAIALAISVVSIGVLELFIDFVGIDKFEFCL
jgi:hypothetical protein